MKITKSQLRQMIREELEPFKKATDRETAEHIIDAYYTWYDEKGYLPGQVTMQMLARKIETYPKTGRVSRDFLRQVAQNRVDRYN
jgi:uncharacterized protein (DUF3820 family)